MFVFGFCVTIVTRNASIHSNRWREQQANKQTFIAWIWDSENLILSSNGRLNLICYCDYEESKWSSWDVVVVCVFKINSLPPVFNKHPFLFCFLHIWHHTLLEVSALALRTRDARDNKVAQSSTECASHGKRWKETFCSGFYSVKQSRGREENKNEKIKYMHIKTLWKSVLYITKGHDNNIVFCTS